MATRTAYDYNNRVLGLNDRVNLRQGVYAGWQGKITKIEDGRIQVHIPPIEGTDGPGATVGLHPRSVERIDLSTR